MNDTQPEALRLANTLSNNLKQHDAEDHVICFARWFVKDSAAELRRQHLEIERLKAERDELLTSLNYITSIAGGIKTIAINAIDKAEGQS